MNVKLTKLVRMFSAQATESHYFKFLQLGECSSDLHEKCIKDILFTIPTIKDIYFYFKIDVLRILYFKFPYLYIDQHLINLPYIMKKSIYNIVCLSMFNVSMLLALKPDQPRI